MSDMTDAEALRQLADIIFLEGGPLQLGIEADDFNRLKQQMSVISGRLDAMQISTQEPSAYAVEFSDDDALVFIDREDAERYIDENRLECDTEPQIIPLYPRPQWRDKPDSEGCWISLERGIEGNPSHACAWFLDASYFTPGVQNQRLPSVLLWLKLPKPEVPR